MLRTQTPKVKSIEEVLERYPRLTAHLICESLGYFDPRSAANAILKHSMGQTFACEWYCHCAQSYAEQALLITGRNQLRSAFTRRHNHTGYMAWYGAASKLVQDARAGGMVNALASWM